MENTTIDSLLLSALVKLGTADTQTLQFTNDSKRIALQSTLSDLRTILNQAHAMRIDFIQHRFDDLETRIINK